MSDRGSSGEGEAVSQKQLITIDLRWSNPPVSSVGVQTKISRS